jgi:polysaccharide export outer membrane protein
MCLGSSVAVQETLYQETVKQDNEQIYNLPVQETKTPSVIYQKEEETSYIEKSFNDRLETFTGGLKEELKQFGYSFFKEKPASLFAPIGKDYTVGPGDQINIYLWGDPVDILNLQGFYSFEIDRDGKIYIPNLGVFYVWGLNVKQIKNLLVKTLKRKFKNFEVDVTLGKLREYPVYVTGFVEKPGIIMVRGNVTLLDVLSLAGGISKDGSLRKVLIRRKEKGKIKKIEVDLYDFFVKGIPIDISIKENDSIYVPAVGKLVAVAGAVKRKGIYEIKNEKTLKDLIFMAGGVLPSVNITGIKINRIDKTGFIINSTDLSQIDTFNLKDGDLVYIEQLRNFVDRKIEVKGHVKYPGVYPYRNGTTLKDLIEKVGILPDTNLYYGEILRKIVNTNRYEVINFVPLEVIKGLKNVTLKNQDVISFYPDWIYKPIVVSGFIKNPLVVPYYKGIRLLDVIRNIKLDIEPRKLKVEIYKESKVEASKGRDLSYDNDMDNDSYQERSVYERTVYLYDLLIRGDGRANIPLDPGDKVLLKVTEDTEKDKTVTILGEVKNPGIYKYKPGMRLYDVIKLAGGYTEDAYPKGLIFIRESAKKLQEQQLQISMLALEESLSKSEEGISAVGATAEEQKVLEMAIQKQKRLLSILKQKAKMGLGRIALDIPNSLKKLKNSPDNIELSDGDYIYIPSKPNYVLVLGGVYNQISLPYRKNLTVQDYLEQVGGLKDNADVDDIYIIKANGRVLSKKQFASINFVFVKYNSFLQYKPEQGDAIVVPTKMKIPIMWRPLLRDITQIIFQSISTAVLAKRL